MLNAVHNQDAKAKLNTPLDEQSRIALKRLPVEITGIATDLVAPGTVIRGRARVRSDDWQEFGVQVKLVRGEDGTTVADTGVGQADQPFEFTLPQTGDYRLQVLGWPAFVPGKKMVGRQWAVGAFHMRADNAILQAPYKKAAWEALRFGGQVGTVPIYSLTDRNRRISQLYADFYNANKSVRWSGMASFTSKGVGDALSNAAQGALAAGLGEQLGFTELPLLGNTAQARELLNKNFDLLAKGNLDIFMDIYPTVLAYADPNGGLAAIQAMQQRNEIGPGLLEAWKTIDAALKANPADDAKLWTGMQQMVDYEQRQVLQPTVFGQNRAFWTTFTQTYGSYIKSTIPGTRPFLTVVPNGDLGSDADRLRWFDEDLLPAWKAWAAANPGNIDVVRLLEGGYK